MCQTTRCYAAPTDPVSYSSRVDPSPAPYDKQFIGPPDDLITEGMVWIADVTYWYLVRNGGLYHVHRTLSGLRKAKYTLYTYTIHEWDSNSIVGHRICLLIHL